MKAVVIALAAATAFAGVANASATDKEFVNASLCRGLAESENLGKLDTTALETFLRTEAAGRSDSVRVSAFTKMSGARKKADAADAGKKAKLIAERDQVCAPFITAAAQ